MSTAAKKTFVLLGFKSGSNACVSLCVVQAEDAHAAARILGGVSRNDGQGGWSFSLGPQTVPRISEALTEGSTDDLCAALRRIGNIVQCCKHFTLQRNPLLT